MENLSEETLSEFREIFNLVDRNGGGSISKDELSELMRMLGMEVGSAEIGAMISEMDSDANEECDFEEFVKLMSKKVTAPFSQEHVKGAFKEFQGPGDKDGCISTVHLVEALTTFGTNKLTAEEATALIAQVSRILRISYMFPESYSRAPDSWSQ